MSNTVWIGIDPDTEKSGVAVWENKRLSIYTLEFVPLVRYLEQLAMEMRKNTSEKKVRVRLEAGWLNQKSNWHNEKSGARVSSTIGKYVGANHQTGKLITKFMDDLEIPYELVKPTNKKVDKDFFQKVTGYKLRTNQDQRDAAMLVYGLI